MENEVFEQVVSARSAITATLLMLIAGRNALSGEYLLALALPVQEEPARSA